MEKTLTEAEALDYIADGHAIYSVETAQAVLKALNVPWDDSYAYVLHNQPGIWKGAQIAPENEGKLGVNALTLGHVACKHYGLEPESKMGRGSQGQAFADCLEKHLYDSSQDSLWRAKHSG